MITFTATAHLAHWYAHHLGYVIHHLHGRWWRVIGIPGSGGGPKR